MTSSAEARAHPHAGADDSPARGVTLSANPQFDIGDELPLLRAVVDFGSQAIHSHKCMYLRALYRKKINECGMAQSMYCSVFNKEEEKNKRNPSISLQYVV